MNRISLNEREREREALHARNTDVTRRPSFERRGTRSYVEGRLRRAGEECWDGNIFPEGWTRYACRDVFTVHPSSSYPLPFLLVDRVSSFTLLLLRHTATQSRDSLVRRKRNHDRVESSDGRQRENGLSVSSSRVGGGINDIIDARRETSTRLHTITIK